MPDHSPEPEGRSWTIFECSECRLSLGFPSDEVLPGGPSLCEHPASGYQMVEVVSASHLREAEARAGRLETALWHFREATDWYVRCLEDVQNHRVVRGLGEAKVGYDRARAALRELGEDGD